MRIGRIPPLLMKDVYKVGHVFQYPDGTGLVYSNNTPRGTRRNPAPPGVINCGQQFFVKEYLVDQFNELFFEVPRDKAIHDYKRVVDAVLGKDKTKVDHIGELHELGYLPLHVKALPEGMLVPYRVPTMTIRNTGDDRFFWLTNALETLISNCLWLMPTSATTAFEYRKTFEEFGKKTGVDPNFVPWQGHDFSMRGMDPWSSIISAAAHLFSFYGTDTMAALLFLEEYYGANLESELIGGSVPATEHSVMCMGLEQGEFETFERLITKVYPEDIVSIVSDTWDLGRVLTDYLPRLKDTILQREGKVVIRPDSGKPADILCGNPSAKEEWERKGVFRCLYDVFGGTRNSSGYIDIDPHVGAIYGDSITKYPVDIQREILERMSAQGFSTYVVLGVGSFTYQYVTRDTDGWAIKATYGEVEGKGRAIFKQPKTDSGLKNSAKGLLKVEPGVFGPRLVECVGKEEEARGLLQTIFLDGQRDNLQTLFQIRERVASYL